ncbi:hypothetical protein D7U93_05210 [Stenotrophomonas maltophilia]|nr:hypothetical protein [Stenotrophomonas maltophilia]MBA0407460.1 hypothetical protein [Stenotrophomonas maltophilia]MBA0424761.1 hypothetical protein [Stenotrophomonas maltophilia]MBA0480287.1 hypothetical protein [Stenotrophomonas maltophilia]MBA0489148.1 hypothetical protein [Stenotrophomonas maltophilia]
MVEPCREAGGGYVRTGALAQPTTGIGFFAGLRPAPVVVPAAGRQPQKQRQQRAIRGLAGRCRPWSTHSVRYRKSRWGQIRFPPENGSDPKSISDRSRETVEGGVGPVAGVSAAWMPRPSPHG